MADQSPLRVLILGAGNGEITFLDRLIQGLLAQNIRIIMNHAKWHKGRSMVQNSIRYLWTPPIKGSWITHLIPLIYLLLSSVKSKYHHWLSAQVRKGRNLKEKYGLFMRYAPFCHGNFDVIYFPWNSTAITYHGLFEIGLPVVISCRGSQINIRPHLPCQDAYVSGLRETLQEATSVHCVSRVIMHEALSFGLNPQNAAIIRPAVDPAFFKPPAAHSQKPHLKIINTGSLTWNKAYESMLLAFKHFIERGVDAELHILGEGYMQQPILFTIHDLGLTERVYMHGRVTPEEVRKHLQNSDVFMLSSLSEGISNAVLEAMCCGLPVVSTDCGGMSEAISDGVEGFLVPLHDPKAMADALYKLAADPGLREKMGKAGRDRVVKQFNLSDQVQAFIYLFESNLTT